MNSVDYYHIHCQTNDFTDRTPRTLTEVAAILAEAKTDGDCPGVHYILPVSVTSGADAEWVADVMSVDLLS